MSAWSLGAGLAVAAAVVLALPPPRWVVSGRLGPLPGRRRRGPALPRAGPVRLAVAGAPLVALPWLTGTLAPALVAVTAVAAGVFVLRQVRQGRARAAAVAGRSRTCAALDLLAADLRAGVLPQRALAGLAAGEPALVPAARAAELGQDVPAALRAAAASPGAEPLAEAAGAWHVAERSGAPLAAVLERLAESVREDAEVAREVRAEAAPARATGRLMAGLPVLGLSLGAGLGVDPVHLLTRTTAGAACLAAGTLLACLGMAWVDRIAATAERSA